MIEIIDYSDEYARDFKQLNLAWLNKYNLAEDYDLEIINDPKKNILDKGGYIYLGKIADEIVATAGLVNEGNSVFELVKMSISR